MTNCVQHDKVGVHIANIVMHDGEEAGMTNCVQHDKAGVGVVNEVQYGRVKFII